MKTKIALVSTAVSLTAAVLIPAGLAGSTPSRASVGVVQSNLGRILVDGRGHSLYLFGGDSHGKSSCYGACAANWPPLISTGKPRARTGARAALLGRTKRQDGRWQVTYKGHPLYTFIKDTAKGQTNGEGLNVFGAEWDLVSPAGTKVANGAAAPSSGSGGYYGP